MDRFKDARKVGIIGMVGNLFLLIIKIFIAVYSKSQGMLADSLNSLIDIFSSFMTYLGSKISSKPKDNDHAFGHEKAEYIFSLVISIFMMFMAGAVFKNSYMSFINKDKFVFSGVLVVVCLITIVVKVSLFIYTKGKYKKTGNIIIKANMEDHKNDILLTSSTCVGIIMGYYNIYCVDQIVGMIIPIIIFYNAIKLLIDSSRVLMDQNLKQEEIKQISKVVMNNKKILHIDSIAAKPMGAKYLIVIKLSMDGKLSLEDSHNEVGIIKKEILEGFKYVGDVIIHVNPH